MSTMFLPQEILHTKVILGLGRPVISQALQSGALGHKMQFIPIKCVLCLP